MLKYTGHPLVDVGAATIAAFSRKRDVIQLADSDLNVFADYIAENYVVNPLKSFLNVAFPNSGYTQPAFDKTPERRQDYAQRVARSFASPDVLDVRCVFTGDPAVAVAFSDKPGFPLGKSYRQHVPMLTGEDVINFSPNGDAGLPVSGKALLCIQAFPLGCAKVGGKLLGVHSDNPDITLKFARKFLDENLKQVGLARQTGSTKLPEAKASAKTMLIETLVEIEMTRQNEREDRRPYSATAYHLSNSGQSNPLDARNPPLEIYHMPLEVIEFLGAVTLAQYRDAWQQISQRGWLLPRAKKAKSKQTDAQVEDDRPRRNMLYEDLFRLPGRSSTFVRRYFLRIPLRKAFEDDPRRTYSLRDEASLVSWPLTQLFLQKVVHMDDKRIQLIREMGDRLAEYVAGENDQRFFQTFYSDSNYGSVRNAIIRVSNALVKRGQPPLIGFDSYIQVFEEPDDKGRTDWRLARDLVLIRMIERLYQVKWIEQHPEAVPSDVAEDENKEDQQGE